MNKRILKLQEKINTCEDLTMLYRYRAQLYNIRNSQLTTADSNLKNYLLLTIKDKLKDNNITEVSLNLIIKEWNIIGYTCRYVNFDNDRLFLFNKDTDAIHFFSRDCSYFANHYVSIEEHRLITKLIKFYKGGKFYGK